MNNPRLNIALLVVSLLLAATVAACGGLGGGDGTPTPGATATATPVPPTPTPLAGSTGQITSTELDAALLERVVTSLSEQDEIAFHFDLTATIHASLSGIPIGIPVHLAGDFQPPDRSQANLSVSLGFIAFESQTIVVGTTVYTLDPTTQRWQVSQSPSTLLSGPVQVITPVLTTTDTLKLIGEEDSDTGRVLHLRAENIGGLFGEAEQDATIDLWLGAGDLRLQRISVTGALQLADLGQQFASVGSSGPANVEVDILISDYGKQVAIEAPRVAAGTTGAGRAGVRIPAQKSFHIAVGESHPQYNSVPATSGWHYAQPVAPVPWGVYKDFIPDEILLHNLEHAGIGIHYDCPDGCPDLVAQLSEFAKNYSKIVVSPYPGMDTRIALTAWTFIDKFDEFDADRITAFIEDHMNSPDAPEPFVP
ncbi:MAG: DUF3105 domain-containing protein [SAR202 cluster bacterium]|nr:DUF3105 domain-containing protein [SAR202 cluster bacterium]